MKKTVIRSALLIVAAGLSFSGGAWADSSYRFTQSMDGLKQVVPVRPADSYTLEERRTAWRDYAIRNSLNYDGNWNDVDWHVSSGEPLPDAPFPNDHPTGSIDIRNAPYGLHSFALLQSVGRHLDIRSNYDREDLSGFPSLTSVYGSLNIYDNPNLKSLYGAPNFDWVGDHISFASNNHFADFRSLEVITGGVSDYTYSNLLIQKTMVSHPDFQKIPADAYLCSRNGAENWFPTGSYWAQYDDVCETGS